jgi:hypothetical protein
MVQAQGSMALGGQAQAHVPHDPTRIIETIEMQHNKRNIHVSS